MVLTLGRGPFAPYSPGQFNVRFEGPAHVIYWEDYQPRLRAVLNGETIFDTRGAKLLHETAHFGVHYIPREDVRFDLLEPSDHHTHCPFKGDADYWTVRVGDREAENAVWGYPQPLEGAPPLDGYVAFYPKAMDTWFVEDEEVYAHMRDPYHRVDVYPASRHVVVRHNGEIIAESNRPALLYETALPVRYYLPAEDVRTDLLERSDTISPCPYKGDGQHWHLSVNGHRIDDAVWSLPDPLPEGARAKGHYCFYVDKVEVEVDGERVEA